MHFKLESAYNDKPNGLIEISCEDKGASVEFVVSDNGPGVSEYDQATIFSLFKRGDNEPVTRESSTGVGLNILKMLIEEQGGEIRIESELGAGSTFSFDWLK